MGDVGKAERLFREALKIEEENARAYFGLYRILHAASYYKTARIYCMRAHALDPDDALVTLAFIRYTVGETRKAMLGPFMRAHPWFRQATYFDRQKENAAELHEQLAEHKAFELQGIRNEAVVPLTILRYGPRRARGLGVDVAIGNGKPLHLMLDTGASGILSTQKTADKAGLKHLGMTEYGGIGDEGTRKGFFAVSEACTIGTLSYKNCIFLVQEGKGRIAGEEDGLVGTDFFEDYLIHLDFQRRKMILKPFPEREPSQQGYDRTIPPGESGFTPVFRFGHSLCIQTLVNRKSQGLFLLDTGSGLSMMDTTFARLSTKLHGDDRMHVRGVSGRVKEVFEADKAELQFGHFRQNNMGLTALNLNNSGDRHAEVRLSGILGLNVLAMFRLDLDYRNGLVKLDYALH